MPRITGTPRTNRHCKQRETIQFGTGENMKSALTLIGIIALVMGLLWMGQGLGDARWPASSFMIDETSWIYWAGEWRCWEFSSSCSRDDRFRRGGRAHSGRCALSSRILGLADFMPGSILAFVIASIVIEVTPGPNMAYLAALTVSNGIRAGLAAVAGVARPGHLRRGCGGRACRDHPAIAIFIRGFAVERCRLSALARGRMVGEAEAGPDSSDGHGGTLRKAFQRGLITDLLIRRPDFLHRCGADFRDARDRHVIAPTVVLWPCLSQSQPAFICSSFCWRAGWATCCRIRAAAGRFARSLPSCSRPSRSGLP